MLISLVASGCSIGVWARGLFTGDAFDWTYGGHRAELKLMNSVEGLRLSWATYDTIRHPKWWKSVRIEDRKLIFHHLSVDYAEQPPDNCAIRELIGVRIWRNTSDDFYNGYSETGVIVPHYVTIISCLFMLLVAVIAARRVSAPDRAGLCTHCGYDLRASGNRCPECGSPRRADNGTGPNTI
jgi:hypothetical protein